MFTSGYMNDIDLLRTYREFLKVILEYVKVIQVMIKIVNEYYIEKVIVIH